MVSNSEQMSNYEKNLKLSEVDPIAAEIDIFRIKREQAAQIESLFKRIKENYKNTKINDLKELLSQVLEPKTPIYRIDEANEFFGRVKVELGHHILGNPDFKKDFFVNNLDAAEVMNILLKTEESVRASQ